jgi:hypothetical protein
VRQSIDKCGSFTRRTQHDSIIRRWRILEVSEIGRGVMESGNRKIGSGILIVDKITMTPAESLRADT